MEQRQESGQGIESGQGEVDHAKHVADLQAVLEVSLELSATDSLGHLVLAVERAASKVLECEHATLLLYDRDKDLLWRPEEAGNGARHQAQEQIASEVIASGTRIRINDPASDARFDPECDIGRETRNLMAFPLLDTEQNIVGVLQVHNIPPLDPWDDELVKVFDAQVGVAVQRHLLLEHYAEKRRIERDLKLARTIQQGLLPNGDPSFPGFDIAGWNDPADDTGGDFWDHYVLPDGSLALVLADATGHGIGAALMMAACRSLFRATTFSSEDLTQVVERVNRLLYEDLGDSRSVTAVLGFLEGDTLSFLSAGHGPVLRYLAGADTVERQNAHSVPLGIIPDIPWPEAERFTMQSGDIMVLLTDGFFEWENDREEQFGIPRLQELIRQHKDMPARELIATLHRAVVDFAGEVPQNDDLTALVVRKL
ncbi:MAG: GAF domain-containing SpoIIE family protein phosphatase [Acidobacteriota bacterium]